jgi:hypothetical protein
MIPSPPIMAAQGVMLPCANYNIKNPIVIAQSFLKEKIFSNFSEKLID